MDKPKGARICANLRGESAYLFQSEQKRIDESQATTLNLLLLELKELRQYKKSIENNKQPN